MLKVESIQNGIVIDHITAGKGMESTVFSIWRLPVSPLHFYKM